MWARLVPILLKILTYLGYSSAIVSILAVICTCSLFLYLVFVAGWGMREDECIEFSPPLNGW